MAELMDSITVDLEQCGGRPCVCGVRIRVSDVLDLLAVRWWEEKREEGATLRGPPVVAS